jgi:opacity protein-like surface antigen
MLKKTLLRITMVGALTLGVTGLANASNAPGVYVGGQLGWADTHAATSQLPGSPTTGEAAAAVNNHGGYLLTGPWDSTTAKNSINSDGLAGRLFVGYQFSPYLAAEFGFMKFHDADLKGNYTGTTVDSTDFFGPTVAVTENGSYSYKAVVKEQAFDLLAKGILPLQSNFSLYGKLGVAYVHQNITRTDTWSDNAGVQINGDPSISIPTGYTPPSPQKYSRTTNRFMPEGAIGVSYDITPNVPVDLSWTHIQSTNHSIRNIDFISLGLAYKFNT